MRDILKELEDREIFEKELAHALYQVKGVDYFGDTHIVGIAAYTCIEPLVTDILHLRLGRWTELEDDFCSVASKSNYAVKVFSEAVAKYMRMPLNVLNRKIYTQNLMSNLSDDVCVEFLFSEDEIASATLLGVDLAKQNKNAIDAMRMAFKIAKTKEGFLEDLERRLS